MRLPARQREIKFTVGYKVALSNGASELPAHAMGRQLNGSAYKVAETIFMTHGMWCGGWIWENYINYFEKLGYRCVAPTLPFHDVDPKNPPPPGLGTATLLDYADFLEKEINKLDQKPILMGHSMGGLLTQILASRGLGKAAVLLTSASPAGIFALKPSVIKSFSEGLTTWAFWRKPFRPSFEKAVYAMLHLMPENERREYYSKMVYESGRASFEIGFWTLDRSGAARVDERKVTIPVLLVAGGEDRVVPAAIVKKIAAKYKKVSTYKEFPNHAHSVLGQPGWEEVAEYCHEWLVR